MKQYSTFIGMDVQKNSVEIAIAQQGRNREVLRYGKVVTNNSKRQNALSAPIAPDANYRSKLS